MYRITLTRSFDAAHRVVGHRGKCARLHGHTYEAAVEIGAKSLISTDNQNRLGPAGFVCDFADVKKLIDRWDHSTLLWEQDPLIVGALGPGPENTAGAHLDLHDGVIRLPVNPTSENLSRLLARDLYHHILALTSRRGYVRVQISETPSTSASYLVDPFNLTGELL